MPLKRLTNVFVFLSDTYEICDMKSKYIEILLAEDEELVCLGLQIQLELLDMFDFSMHCVNNGEDAIEFLKNQKVDVVILDLHLEKCDGFSTLAMMKNLNFNIPTVVMSNTTEPIEIQQVFKLGAKAFIEKKQDHYQLGNAILKVCEGEEFYSNMAKLNLESFGLKKKEQLSKAQTYFSGRELLILSYLLEGYTSKEIASYLYLSPRTVEGLRSRIMKKTATKSILELAKYVSMNNVKLLGKV